MASVDLSYSSFLHLLLLCSPSSTLPPPPPPSCHSPTPFSFGAQLEGSPPGRILLPPTNQPLRGPKAGALQTLPIPSPSHAAGGGGVPPPAPSLLASEKIAFNQASPGTTLVLPPKAKILLNCLPPCKPCHAKPCLRAPQPALLGGGWGGEGDQTVNPPRPLPPPPRRLP